MVLEAYESNDPTLHFGPPWDCQRCSTWNPPSETVCIHCGWPCWICTDCEHDPCDCDRWDEQNQGDWTEER